MAFVQSSRKDRIGGAAAAIALQGLIGYALIAGLAMHFARAPGDTLDTFAVLPDPPPPPPEPLAPNRVVSRRAEGAASPPNLRAKATELVAPRPIVPPPIPPLVIAAEKPGIGNQAMSGNADIPGPGTGSGGAGDGTGSGRYGNGDSNGGRELPPRQTKGMKRGDYPSDLTEPGIGGTVRVRYAVTTDGRVIECEIMRSSGNRDLDKRTCELMELRFRFKPSRDEDGRPVQSRVVQTWDWIDELDD